MKNLQNITVGVTMNGEVEKVAATWAISGDVDGHAVATGKTEAVEDPAVLEAAAKLAAAIAASGGPLTDAQVAAKAAEAETPA